MVRRERVKERGREACPLAGKWLDRKIRLIGK